MTPVLLVLAAGLGSRYGGLKQLEAVGPGGATLLDYAVYDAARAGFGAVVFVVRPEMDPAFSDQVLPRFVGRVAVRTVHQRSEAVPGTAMPAARTKPWGTAHAVLAAAEVVGAPFAVVNADDFYGREAYEAMADFLRTPPPDDPVAFALVGFRLDRTLSPSGPVNRAICRASAHGWLESVVEVLHLAAAPAGGVAGDDGATPRRYSGTEPVSMNFWAFTPALFPHLEAGFRAFLAGEGSTVPLEKREFLIPTVVQDLIRRGIARVRVIPTGSVWTGMTYPADRAHVAGILRDLVAGGAYPERLWG